MSSHYHNNERRFIQLSHDIHFPLRVWNSYLLYKRSSRLIYSIEHDEENGSVLAARVFRGYVDQLRRLD